jgi:hypothetical protein
MLAKNVQAPQAFRHPALSFTTIASRLAPTGKPTCYAFGFALLLIWLLILICPIGRPYVRGLKRLVTWRRAAQAFPSNPL